MGPIPKFDELPSGRAWIWGEEDNVGTLNFLTPEVVLAARNEIKAGISCALNWEMSQNLKFPPPARCNTTLSFKDSSPGGTYAFDDELHFNPQSGSQIDGLRHFAHQRSKTYYNGLSHQEILENPKCQRNGIEHISKRGGIVARGVLLDVKSWADKEGIKYSPVTRHEISISQLEEIAKEQKVEFREGDILIIRTGFVQWHNEASDEELKLGTRDGKGEYVGVEANKASARWFWDHHFCMVACDTMAFEAWPPKAENGIALHEYMISLWGMSIGELWNLEELGEMCKKQQKWSFFFTSAPLNVAGGISSPPNALCIF